MSHELQFNVAQLLKEGTGGFRSYDLKADISDELNKEVTLVEPLVGHIKMLRTGQDILVTGVLQTTVEKSCGRCLTSFATPITIELEEEFYPTTNILTGVALPPPAEADEANRIDEHHILDLSEVVRQEILVISDAILYCRPDCKGLCPICGRDRNIDPCNCHDEQVDPRWADLLDKTKNRKD